MKDEIKLKDMTAFLENIYKDIKKQLTLEEELEKERKFINKIKGDNEDEAKELLEHIEILDNTDYILHSDKAKALLDYITNLQEGNKNLLEEVENIQKQNNKLIDIINELQEENERLKELCNKYEEEHSTAFKLWTMKMEEMPDYEEKMDYKSRCEKVVELLRREYWIKEHEHNDDVIDIALNILQGNDKD